MRHSTYIVAAALLVASSLSLVACAEEDPLRPSNTTNLCRDGVEYLMFEKTSYSSGGTISFSMSVVPHFKPDGSLYTCKAPILR